MVAHSDSITMAVEEYLALEQTSQVKHEYSHGHVYAMCGGTVAHDRIANNVRTALECMRCFRTSQSGLWSISVCPGPAPARRSAAPAVPHALVKPQLKACLQRRRRLRSG